MPVPSLQYLQIPLAIVCAVSLTLGLPLALNMVWHLRVSNSSPGRGVLRILQSHQVLKTFVLKFIWQLTH